MLFFRDYFLSIIKKIVYRRYNKELMLRIDRDTRLLVLKTEWILFCKSFPSVSIVFNILSLNILLVNNILTLIISRPSSSIFLVNSQILTLNYLVNIIIFSTTSRAIYP